MPQSLRTAERRDDLAQKRNEIDRGARSDLEHALVVDRLVENACGGVRHAREGEAAARTSGAVDIPTRSAPSVRIIRISAGVSKAGPSQAA